MTLLFGKVSENGDPLEGENVTDLQLGVIKRSRMEGSWLRACSLGLHSLKRTANLSLKMMKYLRLQLLWLQETHVSANLLVSGRVFGFALFLQVQFHCNFWDHYRSIFVKLRSS